MPIEALRAAAEVLGTKTTQDTVNAALREVGQRLTRVRGLARLGEMADRGDFDEFLGNKRSWPSRKADDEDDEDEDDG